MEITQQTVINRPIYGPGETVNINLSAIPKHVSDGLCEALDEALNEFHSDPENVAKFKAWRAERKTDKNQLARCIECTV